MKERESMKDIINQLRDEKYIEKQNRVKCATEQE